MRFTVLMSDIGKYFHITGDAIAKHQAVSLSTCITVLDVGTNKSSVDEQHNEPDPYWLSQLKLPFKIGII